MKIKQFIIKFLTLYQFVCTIYCQIFEIMNKLKKIEWGLGVAGRKELESNKRVNTIRDELTITMQ